MQLSVLQTYSVQVVRIATAIVANILVARLLTPEGRGYYAVALAVATLAAQFGSMGLQTANSYLAASDPTLRVRLLANSLVIGGALGPILALIVIGVRAVFPTAIELDHKSLILALIYIPFGIGYMLLQGLLLGCHRIGRYNAIELLNRFVPLLLLAALALTHLASPVAAIATAVVGQIVSCIAAWADLARTHGMEMRISTTAMRASFAYGLKTHLAVLFAYIVFRADLLMVAHLRSVAEAGYYSLATSVAEYMPLPASVVGTMLLPRLSATKDTAAKFRMAMKWLLGIGALMVPVTALSIILAKPAIRVLFGPAYLPAYGGFVWLAPGTYFLGLHVIVVSFISSIGYRMSVPMIWAGCAAVNIAGNLYAIPRFGMVGASLLSSICYTAAFVGVLVVAFRNRVGEKSECSVDKGVGGTVAGSTFA